MQLDPAMISAPPSSFCAQRSSAAQGVTPWHQLYAPPIYRRGGAPHRQRAHTARQAVHMGRPQGIDIGLVQRLIGRTEAEGLCKGRGAVGRQRRANALVLPESAAWPLPLHRAGRQSEQSGCGRGCGPLHRPWASTQPLPHALHRPAASAHAPSLGIAPLPLHNSFPSAQPLSMCAGVLPSRHRSTSAHLLCVRSPFAFAQTFCL